MKISLRADGAAGEKFWEAEATPTGVTIRFGPIGKKPKSQIIPLKSCKSGSSMDEAIKRAEEKRNDGYWEVDPEDNADPQNAKNSRPDSLKGEGLGAIRKNEWF